MISLITTIGILILIYVVQDKSVVLAGAMAVLPVKIISTALMVYEQGSISEVHSVIGSMLIWQFVWGFSLLGVYLLWK